ncbi:hypothetical protein LX15_001085 [Streptoalloteichus tenebrarius]|uniref:Uncharacterized protein n=1 Tax=Streptoalloteichus tenebrarius (strain ATCC 17920 / DSM 40477 / JCM 4838 / CBS 697.72 / NBRC 16177 / NCIMB 11028 / NRRL B-12390 / A12253. 1 / ISP 5477) TaxID=1933 RepID=A0ABT1HPG7_STRSD|nr:hypothetical protein [Streptoalloteichus tenebrarius]BFE98346.1 hypothetical protein GCM10020241_00220 [Streptoalloteichus tenebrarius]
MTRGAWLGPSFPGLTLRYSGFWPSAREGKEIAMDAMREMEFEFERMVPETAEPAPVSCSCCFVVDDEAE